MAAPAVATTAANAMAASEVKLGVLRLDGWDGHGYVPLDGDTEAKASFVFPFVTEVAREVTFDRLCDPETFKSKVMIEALLKGMKDAVKVLIKKRVGAIISNCGLFMWLHATGVLELAVDQAMAELAEETNNDALGPYIQPFVALSSLVQLASFLPMHGIGKAQEEARSAWNGSIKECRTCKVVVYTSNGNSCTQLLKQIPQLKGQVKVFTHGEEEGDVLVVGLNGDCVIGLENRPQSDGGSKVGGNSINGFEAVAKGTAVYYNIVQPDMEIVAKAVKKTYPNICFAMVECTEVSAYSDTIKEAMCVPVFDPISLADGMIAISCNHDFKQLSNAMRTKAIAMALHLPIWKVAESKDYDKSMLGDLINHLKAGSLHLLQSERERALAILEKYREKMDQQEDLEQKSLSAKGDLDSQPPAKKARIEELCLKSDA